MRWQCIPGEYAQVKRATLELWRQFPSHTHTLPADSPRPVSLCMCYSYFMSFRPDAVISHGNIINQYPKQHDKLVDSDTERFQIRLPTAGETVTGGRRERWARCLEEDEDVLSICPLSRGQAVGVERSVPVRMKTRTVSRRGSWPGSGPHTARVPATRTSSTACPADSYRTARPRPRALSRLRTAALPSPASPTAEQPSQGSRHFRRRVRSGGSGACAAPVLSPPELQLLLLLSPLPPQPSAARY